MFVIKIVFLISVNTASYQYLFYVKLFMNNLHLNEIYLKYQLTVIMSKLLISSKIL